MIKISIFVVLLYVLVNYVSWIAWLLQPVLAAVFFVCAAWTCAHYLTRYVINKHFKKIKPTNKAVLITGER